MSAHCCSNLREIVSWIFVRLPAFPARLPQNFWQLSSWVSSTLVTWAELLQCDRRAKVAEKFPHCRTVLPRPATGDARSKLHRTTASLLGMTGQKEVASKVTKRTYAIHIICLWTSQMPPSVHISAKNQLWKLTSAASRIATRALPLAAAIASRFHIQQGPSACQQVGEWWVLGEQLRTASN